MDKKTKEITEAWNAAHQLNRIANAMEEILRLVKVDQAKTEKRMNGMSEEPSHTHEEIVELTK